MAERRSPLRVLDRLEPPDLWSDIRERSPGPVPHSPRRPRVFAAVLALVVGAAGVTVVVRAFSGAPVRPATTPSPASELAPHEVTTISVGPNGQTNAILAAEGSVWVTAYGVEGGGGVDRDALFRIDPTTNQIIAKIPVETVPTFEVGGAGMAYGDGSIWVTGGGRLPGQGDGSQALLARVDPATNEVLATIPLGGRWGADVAVDAAGVWVGISGDEHADVVRVDPATNEIVARIPLASNYVWRLAATDEGVLVEERVWEGNDGPCNVLTAIDATANAVVARQPADDPCTTQTSVARTLRAWQGTIWGEFQQGEDVVVGPIDPRTALPTGEGFAFEPGHFPRGFLVPDETGFWYGAYPGGNGNRPDRLARMDPTSGKITEYMELDGAISAVVLDGSLWTLNYGGTVTRIDLFPEASVAPTPVVSATPTPTPTPSGSPATITTSASDAIPIQQGPGAVSAVTYGFRSVWVASFDGSERGSITRLDAETGEELTRIPTGDVLPTWEVGGGDLTVGDGSVWFAGASPAPGEPGGVHAYLLRIDPTTNEVVATVDLRAAAPADVAIDDRGVWVMSDGLGGHPQMEVSLIDPSTNEVAATIPLDSWYGHHLFNVDGWIVAGTNAGSGSRENEGGAPEGVLNVIDPATATEVRTMPAAGSPVAGDGALWLTTGDALERVDPSTGQVFERYGVRNTGDAATVGEGGIWFLDPEGRTTVERFDPSVGAVDLRVRLPEGTTPIAMTTSPGTLWVLNYEGSVTRVALS